MGAVGTFADNAAAESFFASLKREILPARRGRPTERAARLAIFGRLGFYNHQRRHSTIGYLARSPSNRDQLRRPSLHDNRCPRSRWKPCLDEARGLRAELGRWVNERILHRVAQGVYTLDAHWLMAESHHDAASGALATATSP
jgi:hypothetical protein